MPLIDFHRDLSSTGIHHHKDYLTRQSVDTPLLIPGGELANTTDLYRIGESGLEMLFGSIMPFKYRYNRKDKQYDNYPTDFQKEVKAQIKFYHDLAQASGIPVRLQILTNLSQFEDFSQRKKREQTKDVGIVLHRIRKLDSDEYFAVNLANGLRQAGLDDLQIHKILYLNGINFIQRAFEQKAAA